MKLGSLINLLEKVDRNKYVNQCIGNPHSWRGSYDELSFEVDYDREAGEILDMLKACIGHTFCGWKGGVYVYNEETHIHFSFQGSSEEHDEWLIEFISSLME